VNFEKNFREEVKLFWKEGEKKVEFV